MKILFSFLLSISVVPAMAAAYHGVELIKSMNPGRGLDIYPDEAVETIECMIEHIDDSDDVIVENCGPQSFDFIEYIKRKRFLPKTVYNELLSGMQYDIDRNSDGRKKIFTSKWILEIARKLPTRILIDDVFDNVVFWSFFLSHSPSQPTDCGDFFVLPRQDWIEGLHEVVMALKSIPNELKTVFLGKREYRDLVIRHRYSDDDQVDGVWTEHEFGSKRKQQQQLDRNCAKKSSSSESILVVGPVIDLTSDSGSDLEPPVVDTTPMVSSVVSYIPSILQPAENQSVNLIVNDLDIPENFHFVDPFLGSINGFTNNQPTAEELSGRLVPPQQLSISKIETCLEWYHSLKYIPRRMYLNLVCFVTRLIHDEKRVSLTEEFLEYLSSEDPDYTDVAGSSRIKFWFNMIAQKNFDRIHLLVPNDRWMIYNEN